MSLKELCFSFRGRINRAQYWAFGGITAMLLMLLAAIFDNASYSSSYSALIMMLLTSIGMLLILYMDIPVCVKRLHDVGASGWNLLWVFCPILGFIVLFIWLGFVKGDKDTNKYGPPPEAAAAPPEAQPGSGLDITPEELEKAIEDEPIEETEETATEDEATDEEAATEEEETPDEEEGKPTIHGS